MGMCVSVSSDVSTVVLNLRAAKLCSDNLDLCDAVLSVLHLQDKDILDFWLL